MSDVLAGLRFSVERILDRAWGGVHNVRGWYKRREQLLSSERAYVSVRVNDGIATFDGSHLTALVVAAHDECVRMEVCAVRRGELELRFWNRGRAGRMYERHPDIEQAIVANRPKLEDVAP